MPRRSRGAGGRGAPLAHGAVRGRRRQWRRYSAGGIILERHARAAGRRRPVVSWRRTIRRREWSARAAGHVVRLVDSRPQAIDFLCYAAATQRAVQRGRHAQGRRHLSSPPGTRCTPTWPAALHDRRDTCGRHDTIGGCCSAESNRLRYGSRDAQLRDNFLRALAAWARQEGHRRQRELLHERAGRADGRWRSSTPVAAGDYVDSGGDRHAGRAVELSSDLQPCNAAATPIRLVVYAPLSGGSPETS